MTYLRKKEISGQRQY